ncbi:MAG: delta-60 repeat domain-containing protein [Verrucomicrobiia bacterium]
MSVGHSRWPWLGSSWAAVRTALPQAPGDLDLSFNAGSGIDRVVHSLAAQPDGKVLIGGNFRTVKDATRRGLARLNSDGSADPTFVPGVEIDYQFYDTKVHLLLAPDGKVLIAGEFTTVGTSRRVQIARLNADGSLDDTFNPNAGPDTKIWTLALQADGKVLIGGQFSEVTGVHHSPVGRLNADGTPDPGSCIALQNDGQVLVGGGLTMFNNHIVGNIARLNADGSIDWTFNPGLGIDDPLQPEVRSLTVQPDGKVLIAGGFTRVKDVIPVKPARVIRFRLPSISPTGSICKPSRLQVTFSIGWTPAPTGCRNGSTGS